MNTKSKSTLEKFEKILRVENYSENTIRCYINFSKKFLSSFSEDIYHISTKRASSYLMDLKYSSVSQQNQYINSIKLLYKKVVGLKINDSKFKRPRKEKKLPRVISAEHIESVLPTINNIKHRSILTIAYSVGLRVSEVINLKIEDIDSKRMVINIIQAKGRKDRVVPLTENVLQLLRQYFIEYRPKEYLFNGQNSLKYSSTSCNKLVKKYLGSDYHFHLLRHSCFTNLTEKGIDIRIIQKLAGHNSCKTTEIYTHVSKRTLNSLPLY